MSSFAPLPPCTYLDHHKDNLGVRVEAHSPRHRKAADREAPFCVPAHDALPRGDGGRRLRRSLLHDGGVFRLENHQHPSDVVHGKFTELKDVDVDAEPRHRLHLHENRLLVASRVTHKLRLGWVALKDVDDSLCVVVVQVVI